MLLQHDSRQLDASYLHQTSPSHTQAHVIACADNGGITMAITYSDTMIGSADIKRTAAYYRKVLKMKVVDKGNKSYLTLADVASNQRLCIIAEPKMKNASLSFQTDNIEKALLALKKHGGKVSKRYSYPSMVGANCTDADGHAIIIWQLITAK